MKREIVQIAMSVEIEYSTPEGRKVAIECAKSKMRLDFYSTAHGGIGARKAAPRNTEASK